VVKLVRSKGVGIYFVTQNPIDVPEAVLAQLSNRVQHALRAYTPREQKAVRVAAETFRPNPAFSTEEAITQLGTGEALVSVIEDKGIPSMVGRTLIRPPSSRLGPILPEERRSLIANSPVAGVYDAVVDRQSAFEVLAERTKRKQEDEERQRQLDEQLKTERTYQDNRRPAPRSNRQSPAEAAVKSFTRSVATQLGNALVRGILGSLKRGR
jgi:hypothetical protein